MRDKVAVSCICANGGFDLLAKLVRASSPESRTIWRMQKSFAGDDFLKQKRNESDVDMLRSMSASIRNVMPYQFDRNEMADMLLRWR